MRINCRNVNVDQCWWSIVPSKIVISFYDEMNIFILSKVRLSFWRFSPVMVNKWTIVGSHQYWGLIILILIFIATDQLYQYKFQNLYWIYIWWIGLMCHPLYYYRQTTLLKIKCTIVDIHYFGWSNLLRYIFAYYLYLFKLDIHKCYKQIQYNKYSSLSIINFTNVDIYQCWWSNVIM